VTLQRWEYLSVQRDYKTEQRVRQGSSGEETYWHFEHFWSIWRPGASESENPEGWSTSRPDGVGLVGLLSDLGAEGWELVSQVVLRSVITSHSFGWADSSGTPIQMQWVFKRPILDPAS
jgi:hypothetical protein